MTGIKNTLTSIWYHPIKAVLMHHKAVLMHVMNIVLGSRRYVINILLVNQLIIKCYNEGTPEEVLSSFAFILSVDSDTKLDSTGTFVPGAEWFHKVAQYVVNEGLNTKPTAPCKNLLLQLGLHLV